MRPLNSQLDSCFTRNRLDRGCFRAGLEPKTRESAPFSPVLIFTNEVGNSCCQLQTQKASFVLVFVFVDAFYYANKVSHVIRLISD